MLFYRKIKKNKLNKVVAFNYKYFVLIFSYNKILQSKSISNPFHNYQIARQVFGESSPWPIQILFHEESIWWSKCWKKVYPRRALKLTFRIIDVVISCIPCWWLKIPIFTAQIPSWSMTKTSVPKNLKLMGHWSIRIFCLAPWIKGLQRNERK